MSTMAGSCGGFDSAQPPGKVNLSRVSQENAAPVMPAWEVVFVLFIFPGGGITIMITP